MSTANSVSGLDRIQLPQGSEATRRTGRPALTRFRPGASTFVSMEYPEQVADVIAQQA
jgi:hypothetical protein